MDLHVCIRMGMFHAYRCKIFPHISNDFFARFSNSRFLLLLEELRPVFAYSVRGWTSGYLIWKSVTTFSSYIDHYFGSNIDHYFGSNIDHIVKPPLLFYSLLFSCHLCLLYHSILSMIDFNWLFSRDVLECFWTGCHVVILKFCSLA